MKHLYALFAAVMTTCLLHAQDEAKLVINLKGVEKTDTLTLQWGAINKSMNPHIANTLARHPDTLRVPLNEPRLMVVGLKGYIGGYELIASPGECITITGRIIYDRTGKKPEAIFRKMKAKGSHWQSTYARVVRDYIYHLDSLDTDMDQDYKGIKKIIFWAKQKNDEQAIADMYQTRDGQAYITRVTSNFNDRNDYLRILIERHKDSFLVPMLMLRFGERLNPQQQPLYDSLSETAKQSYYGREVKDEVYPPTMQGETAPTVNVYTRDGDNKLLNFTTHGNRLLLIDFWASWCQPCLKEIPTLKRIYETYHEQGLDIISISADQATADWIEALDDQQIPWCNYIDLDRQAIVEYKVQYIPTIYLLDSRGRVIAEKLRGAELEDFIKKLFKKLKKNYCCPVKLF